VLDEVVAPVVLVQDLTKGPYQAGVTPCIGTLTWSVLIAGTSSWLLLLNDKIGSVTPDLGIGFAGRSISISWIEIQNSTTAIEAIPDLQLRLGKRENALLGVPTVSDQMTSILENDGVARVPVEQFNMSSGVQGGRLIWRGQLGDNLNTLGSRRIIEPEPQLVLGPRDVLILTTTNTFTADQALRVNIRGFYQEQPS